LVFDFLQPQSATVCRSVMMNGIGRAEPPSCVPSQKGWVLDWPQEQ